MCLPGIFVCCWRASRRLEKGRLRELGNRSRLSSFRKRGWAPKRQKTSGRSGRRRRNARTRKREIWPAAVSRAWFLQGQIDRALAWPDPQHGMRLASHCGLILKPARNRQLARGVSHDGFVEGRNELLREATGALDQFRRLKTGGSKLLRYLAHAGRSPDRRSILSILALNAQKSKISSCQFILRLSASARL